jgi:hypothetical protein
MTVQAFDIFTDCVVAAHSEAKKNEFGYAFAVKWPLGHCTVETRKPSLRSHQMKVIECRKDGSEVLA